MDKSYILKNNYLKFGIEKVYILTVFYPIGMFYLLEVPYIPQFPVNA
jgi:hypothetical protein